MLENLSTILRDVTFWKYVSIPLLSAVVGWFTNVIALKMTFYPLNFVGIGKIGWQGIIPSRAGVMAGKAVDLLTGNLLTIEDRFDQIEPERVAEEMEPALNRLMTEILEETMEKKVPVIWEAAPSLVKSQILQRASEDLPEVVEDLMQDVKNNITDLFDLRSMVIEALENDRNLLNQIFLKVGDKEFRFIERSGLYFGFLFGLVQMGLFLFTSYLGFEAGWILPLAGLFVGWATNFIALRMIFEPLRKRKVGPWTFQGLFIRRQMEVADAYARIVTDNILSSRNILERLISGPASDRLMNLIQTHIKRAVDSVAGNTKSLLLLTQGTHKYLSIKRMIAQRFTEELPRSLRHVFDYAEEALDIEDTLRAKMQGLGPVEFVSFLRPVFQEDEWKLILAGAILGFMAGMTQWLLVFGVSV